MNTKCWIGVGVLAISAAAAQEQLRWSKDYIYSGQRLLATVTGTGGISPGGNFRAFAPIISKAAPYTTQLAVFNVNPALATPFTLRLFNPSGQVVSTISLTLPPYGSAFFDHGQPGSGLDNYATWRGSAVVESTLPVYLVIVQYR